MEDVGGDEGGEMREFLIFSLQPLPKKKHINTIKLAALFNFTEAACNLKN